MSMCIKINNIFENCIENINVQCNMRERKNEECI